MRVKEIKECGVYALPDGRELVAHCIGGGRQGFIKLYDQLSWNAQGPPVYETDERGVLTSMGRPTPWRIEDLKDVGREAPRRH